MSFSDAKHLLYPVVLSLSVVGGLALMRAIDPASDAMAGEPAYAQQSSRMSAGQNPAGSGPLFNTSAIHQRNVQIELLTEILSELKVTRRLLESGSARVTVESVELDYQQISDLVAATAGSESASESPDPDEVSAGSVSASRAPGSGTGSGVIRRIQGGSVVSEQTSE
jgi:hypothetical protein